MEGGNFYGVDEKNVYWSSMGWKSLKVVNLGGNVNNRNVIGVLKKTNVFGARNGLLKNMYGVKKSFPSPKFFSGIALIGCISLSRYKKPTIFHSGFMFSLNLDMVFPVIVGLI